jgi:Domain of unknown function (DUF4123)
MTAAGRNWFAIIDGAQDPRLVPLIQSCREHDCLFAGKLEADLAAASPWIVRIDERDQLLSTWQAHGRGLNWGIMIEAQVQLADLRRHFRKFLQAKLPDGMIALFRFYDPRVFNTYIRAALPEEREPWFSGGIAQYAVEDEGGAVMRQYRLSHGRLMDGHVAIG